MSVPVQQTPATPVWDRLCAVLVLGVGGFLAYALLQVTPDARGFGTHEQLGMAPCGWPDAVGYPCPTCGGTTAACYLVHLSPVRAVVTQPFGAAVAAAGLWLTGWAAVCLAAGRSFLDPLVRLPYGSILLWTLVLFFGSWGYKVLTFSP
jgi:hypothetical protein